MIMAEAFRAVKVTDKVYWVGAIDWGLRDFHGYSTELGSSYNSYLVVDNKTALFDTVKCNFLREHVGNIREVIEPSKIDYLIVNHVEMDHSGCIPEIVKLIQPEKIFCSQMAVPALERHFHDIKDWPINVVKDGDSISLGKRTVQFLETRMLHWPDSMVSYLKEDRALISSDIFGQHWATSERYDDEVDFSELIHQASKYYNNIVLPYSPLVQKLIARIGEAGLKFDLLLPDHGLIWRKHIGDIVSNYDKWSKQIAQRKATIIYDTMWHSTEMMANAIADGLIDQGICTKVMNLAVNHRSDIITEIVDSKAVLFGSPTLNNGVLPRVADMMSYLKGLRPEGKIGASFGSFGWGGESVKIMNSELEAMKIPLVDDGIKIKYVPTHDELGKCRELGVKVGKAIKGDV